MSVSSGRPSARPVRSRPPARPGARFVRLAATLAVTSLLVAVLVRDFGGAGILTAWRHARVVWVAVAFAISCGCVLLGALRWKLVLAAMDRRLAFGRALAVVLATWPPAVVTPSRANELLRALAVRDEVPLTSGASSVLAEKSVDLAMLLALAAAGAAVQTLWTWTAVAAGLLALQALAIAVVVRRPRWMSRLPLLGRPGLADSLFEGFDALRRERGRLASICAISIGIRLLTAGVAQALLVSVGTRVRFFDTLALWPAATLVGVAPLTLGGMGTRDATFIYLLGRAGGFVAAPATLLAATMGYSAVAVWSFALIGLPLMFREGVFGGITGIGSSGRPSTDGEGRS